LGIQVIPANSNFVKCDNLLVIMITQRRLRHLLQLVEYGHFGRAAAALNISQPALTKSIQALETELGVRLLDRKRGAVTLTAFGELVVLRSRSLLNAEEDMLHEIRLLAGLEAGSLRVALGPYPSTVSGYPALARLLARSPKIGIAVHVAGWRDVMRQVIAREVDLGLAELGGLPVSGQFEMTSVGQHRARYFCRPQHPVLGRGPVPLADLLEFPWITTRLPPRIAAGLPQAACKAGHIDPLTGDFVPAIEIDVPFSIAALIAGNDALALSSLALMEQDLAAGSVVLVPTTGVEFRTDYGFIHLKNRSLTPAALAYMQEILAVEADHVRREAALARRFDPHH
jgi:DNA-binding transcriptional LysR family regulator